MKHNLPVQFSKRKTRGVNTQTYVTELDDADDSFLGARNRGVEVSVASHCYLDEGSRRGQLGGR